LHSDPHLQNSPQVQFDDEVGLVLPQFEVQHRSSKHGEHWQLGPQVQTLDPDVEQHDGVTLDFAGRAPHEQHWHLDTQLQLGESGLPAHEQQVQLPLHD
jgi:hypothetical protein